MPYTTRVNGNETEIVGYSYTANGTPEPEVGNDWYPVVIDSYTTAEYENLDAYLASEYGKILLASCKVTALVPLATATQRLADNGINITVHDKKGLYTRDAGGSNGLVVDKEGRAVYFKGGDDNFVLRFSVTKPNVLTPTKEDEAIVAALVQEYGLGTQLPQPLGNGTVFNIDGISYTSNQNSDGFYFTPALSAWE